MSAGGVALVGAFGFLAGVLLTLLVEGAWGTLLDRVERARFAAFNRALSEGVGTELRSVPGGVPHVRKASS